MTVHAGEPSDTPTLEFLVESGGLSDPGCFESDQFVFFRVHVGPATRIINGGQFVIEYDPACLDFVSISPAGPPYLLEVFQSVDEAAGVIVYGIGILLGGAGVPGDADMAVLTFTKVGGCPACDVCFGGGNPFNTYLVDTVGQAVLVVPSCSDPLRWSGPSTIVTPPDMTVNATCAFMAEVEWEAPSVSSACGGSAQLTCSGEYVHTGAEYPPEVALHGGDLPVGISTFCCLATNDCGGETESCWTIQVLLAAPPHIEATEPTKNRYLSFNPGISVHPRALRVTVVDAQGFPNSSGAIRWVGPPLLFENTTAGDMALGAGLQCTPYYQVWDSEQLLHIYGSEVVPGSVYQVDAIVANCDRNYWYNYSEPIVIPTAPWGDIIGTSGDLTFSDIVAVTDYYRDAPNAPSKTQTQLQPNVPAPAQQVSFSDVSQAVNAFRGFVYPFAGPGQCP